MAIDVHQQVQQYYSKDLHSTQDRQSFVSAVKPLHPRLAAALENVPPTVQSKFYGCGNPIPFGISGMHVLDLGAGSGRDVYLAAQLVGAKGKVVGVDMTKELVEVAQKGVAMFTRKMKYEKPNVEFVQGYIEKLTDAGVQDSSFDLVISNCVLNLCPSKRSVLAAVYKALKPGGEFHFADVYADRRVPDAIRQNKILYGECMGGALYVNDFLRICREVGFVDPRPLTMSMRQIKPKFQMLMGNTHFFSVTFRLFKLPNLEDGPQLEDYGQYAIYKGGIEEHPFAYELDTLRVFETGKPTPVDGNTAEILSSSWLSPYFTVVGDRSHHYGPFPLLVPPVLPAAPLSLTPDILASSSSSSASSSSSFSSAGDQCGCGKADEPVSTPAPLQKTC